MMERKSLINTVLIIAISCLVVWFLVCATKSSYLDSFWQKYEQMSKYFLEMSFGKRL